MTELGIPLTTLNLLRNDLMKFSCGPLVYRIIIDWGFAKPDGIKIVDHIKHLKIGDTFKKKKFPKWLKDNESKLDKDSFSDFDITALHDFLPILCCNKITQRGDIENDERLKDPNSVESLLKEIKDFRNEVSHEYAGAVKDNTGKMRDTMKECIRTAGKLYDKDDTEIDEKVKLLDDEFNKIFLDTTHFYEKRVTYIAQKISSEFPSNMLERYSPNFSVPLPGSSKKIDTSDIFQCSNLSIITEVKENKAGRKIYNKTVFPCTELYNSTQEKFVVITGGPGSGKTTLMKNICQDILQTSIRGCSPRYVKIEHFKIPIYLECRYELQTNFAKFLRESLKNFLSPEDDIYEAFKLVKGLVFLCDGYDEVTDNCRQLIDSIIAFCRDNNASCIVSSRVDAGNNFVSKLQERSLKCTKMFIEPIIEMSDKVNFLRSYADKMDDSIDTDKLLNTFENLTAAAQEVFSSPILLALFISLFVNDPHSVSKMNNEQSAYDAVRTNFLREMERKLRNASYPIGIAEDVAYVLGKFCLQLFSARKYFLDWKDHSKMVAECERILGMPDNVNIPNLLSGILTPEHSIKDTNDTSYQFFHSTIQEFFAVKYVSENIRKLHNDRRELHDDIGELHDDIGELHDDRSSRNLLDSSYFSNMKKAIVRNTIVRTFQGNKNSQSQLVCSSSSEPIVKKFQNSGRAFQDDSSSHSQSEDGQLSKLLKVLRLDESQTDINEEVERYGNIIKLLILETLAKEELSEHSKTFTLMLKKYYGPKKEEMHHSPVYHLDLILSSDSNADIISIVSNSLKGITWYDLMEYRHLKPMIAVIQTMTSAVNICFESAEITNSQQLTKFLTVLKDDSVISLDLCYSHDNYKPLEGEFYTQLKKSKCKLTHFRACVSSEKHLSIVVKSFIYESWDSLFFSTPSLFSFSALEEFKGFLFQTIKYSRDFSITGNNPVREITDLFIEHIPADGKDNTYKLLKHICPKSKEFRMIQFGYCHLTDTDTNDLLKKLHREKIRTGVGERTEVKKLCWHQNNTINVELYLKDSEEERRQKERREEERREKKNCVIS